MKDLRCVLTFHVWTVRQLRDASGEVAKFKVCRRCGKKRDFDGERGFGSANVLGGG